MQNPFRTAQRKRTHASTSERVRALALLLLQTVTNFVCTTEPLSCDNHTEVYKYSCIHALLQGTIVIFNPDVAVLFVSVYTLGNYVRY